MIFSCSSAELERERNKREREFGVLLGSDLLFGISDAALNKRTFFLTGFLDFAWRMDYQNKSSLGYRDSRTAEEQKMGNYRGR